MKILHIIPSLHMGGAQKFAVNLCNELAEEETNEVYLCTYYPLSYRSDETYLLKKQISSKVKMLSMDKTTGVSITIFYKFYKLIKKINPDIVHTHMGSLIYSTLAITCLNIPFVHTLHTLAHKEANNNFKRLLYKILFNYLGVVPVSISPIALEDTIDTFGVKHDMMIVNGVVPLIKSTTYNIVMKEIEELRKSQDTKIFLSVGRITKVKNYLLLIDSIKKLIEMGEDVVLLVIGSLTVEKEYTNICKKAALNCKEIHFLGEKSNVGDYLYCSDALCISSLYEGLPLVCLEAMSLGKPILSTPAGGVPDVVIDSINGYISKDFTPNSYGEILHKFLLSPVRNSAHIIEEFNEKYSMTICKNNYYNLYLKVLKTFK